MLGGAGGVATRASRILRGVVGAEPGDIGSYEGVVNSYLEGSRSNTSHVDGFARFLSQVVLGYFHCCGP